MYEGLAIALGQVLDRLSLKFFGNQLLWISAPGASVRSTLRSAGVKGSLVSSFVYLVNAGCDGKAR